MNVIKWQQKAHRLWQNGHQKLARVICLLIYYLTNCVYLLRVR